MQFYRMVAVRGTMPMGGTNRVEIAICPIPALLAMKGHALNGRYKQKDAYDIYYCIRDYPRGIDALVEDCRRLLEHASGVKGYGFINKTFNGPGGVWPDLSEELRRAVAALSGSYSGPMAARRFWAGGCLASRTRIEEVAIRLDLSFCRNGGISPIVPFGRWIEFSEKCAVNA